MNISLPAPLKEWVEAQVSTHGYATASEYVRDVLRREQIKSAVDARLTQAIESGEATPMTSTDWRRIRSEARKKVRNRRGK